MIGYINVFIFSRTLGPYLTQKKAIKVSDECHPERVLRRFVRE